MQLKRRIDGILSDELIKLLSLLLSILIASFVIFKLVAHWMFPGDYSWNQLLSLYLDAGVYADQDSHPVFALLVTLVGILFLSALLIPVITTLFSNISDAYKKGERRYKGFSDHILILGSGRMIMGMLRKLREDPGVKDILIMTTSPVESLRDKIQAHFSDRKFSKRITYYFDERDNIDNLREACAAQAREIFIIGEDGEEDHDSVSIRCYEALEELCRQSPRPVHCSLVLEEQSSAEIFHYYQERLTKQTQLNVDIVDIKEYLAERALLGRNGEGQLSIDGKGIREDSPQYLHLIIAGMTPMAKAMARAAAHLCHFPNFDPKTGKRKTVITFIAHDIRRKRDIFVSEHQNLFQLSHAALVSFDAEGKPVAKEQAPDPAYGDFLDIAWEFIDTDISSPEAKAYLEKAAGDPEQQLAFAICQASQEDNMSAALHLPRAIYDKNRMIPIYVHLWEQGDAITKAYETGQYGYIYCFGTGTSADQDPLFEKRLHRGQRVNYVYSTMAEQKPEYDDGKMVSFWYGIKESDKFSSIYCGNSFTIKKHSFGDDLSAIGTPLYETEHRRWMMSVLLLGQKAYTIQERKGFKALVAKEKALHPGMKKMDQLPDGSRVSPTWEMLRKRSKTEFYHICIDPYEDLEIEEKEKDRTMMINAHFVMGDTDEIKR